MTIEEKLKNHIIKEYKSLKNFADSVSVPYQTIVTILQRGIKKSNFDNIAKICKALDISIDALYDGEIKIIPPPETLPDKDNYKPTDILRILNSFIALRHLQLDKRDLSTKEVDFLVDGVNMTIEYLRIKRERNDFTNGFSESEDNEQ